jgi:hypothetical protein
LGEIAMLEVANVEHALFAILSQSYSIRCFTATDPNFAGTNPAFREKMEGDTDLWATGSREILQIATAPGMASSTHVDAMSAADEK